jgi:hypothetical protein
MRIAFASVFVALMSLRPAHAAEPLAVSPRNYDGIRRAILPTEAESAWLAIPWRTDLWQARREAAVAGKPILLWEMDGHPLGCT